MPRVVAIAMLLVLLAPVGLPAVTTVSNTVPICCRANGSHHCNAMQEPTGSDRIESPRRCPFAHPVVLPHAAQPQTHSGIAVTEEAHPFLQEFIPGFLTSDGDSSHSDRGPPVASR